MPVTDMITAKTLPIVVYRIHRHGPCGETWHKAQQTRTRENYTLPGMEVHDLITSADIKDVSAEPASSVQVSAGSLHSMFRSVESDIFPDCIGMTDKGA